MTYRIAEKIAGTFFIQTTEWRDMAGPFDSKETAEDLANEMVVKKVHKEFAEAK